MTKAYWKNVEKELKGKKTKGMPRITVRYEGLFDFDGLYAAIIDWTKNYGYIWHEADYKHKVPSPKGAEQEYKWVITKRVTEFVEYELTFTVHVWDLVEVDVDVNGKKKALSNAHLYIWMDGKINYDWQSKFGNGGKLGKFLGSMYFKVLRAQMDSYQDQMLYRMWNLQAIMKEFFDLQSKKYTYKGYLGEN
jgi:hypothetical protein